MKKTFTIIVLLIITFFSFAPELDCLSKITTSVGSFSPLFSKNIDEYNIFLSESITEIYIDATKDKEDEIISGIGKHKLSVGKNKIVVESSEDGKYILNLYRGTSSISNDELTLESLEVLGYNFNFVSSIYNYQITIPESVESLEVKYKPTSEKVKVTMFGNYGLSAGKNLITINVTSDDGKSQATYLIEVNKTKNVFEEEKDENFTLLHKDMLTEEEERVVLAVLISMSTIILLSIFYFMFIYKGKKKRKKRK